MARNWVWVGKYLFVILVALILGAAIGNLALFKTTTLGTPTLTAARLVRFIAYAAALGLLWFGALRASRQMRDTGGNAANLSSPLLALFTVVVVPSFYVVLLQFIRPFLSRDLRPFIVWMFIIGTIAAGVWLVWSLFTNSDAVLEAIGKNTAGKEGSRASSNRSE